MKAIEIKEAFFDELSNILTGDVKADKIDISGMYNLALTLIKKIDKKNDFKVTSYDGYPVSVGDVVYYAYCFADRPNTITESIEKRTVGDLSATGWMYLLPYGAKIEDNPDFDCNEDRWRGPREAADDIYLADSIIAVSYQAAKDYVQKRKQLINQVFDEEGANK